MSTFELSDFQGSLQLDKYADQGIENIENIQILTVPPINEFGSVTEIIKAFGSREEYEKAIRDLENELYKVAQFGFVLYFCTK